MIDAFPTAADLSEAYAKNRIFPACFLDELRARLPVSEVAARHVKLRRRGREWVGLSPFQQERTPSFTVNDAKGFYYDFSSGKHGDIFAFIIEVEGATFPEAVERCAEMAGMALPAGQTPPASSPRPATAPTRPRAADAEEAARERYVRRAAAEIWRGASDVGGTLAARYLAGRKLVLPEGVSNRVLRFCARCPWTADDGTLTHVPALISLYRDIHTDRPAAILRRALTPSGEKRGKPRSLGAMAGTAVKLTADEDVEQGLIVGEGVETMLAAMMFGLAPAWALGGPGLRNFPVLGGIDALGLVVDNDANKAGQSAAAECFDRWTEAGREVICHTPNVTGHDMNDVLQGDADD